MNLLHTQLRQDKRQILICPHFPMVILYRNIKNTQEEHKNLQERIRNKNIKCSTCFIHVERPWICLSCSAAFCDHTNLYLLFTHSKTSNSTTQMEHNIFINIPSCEIICTFCNAEILDFEQYGKSGNEEEFKNWVNPYRLRLEYHQIYRQYKHETIIQRQLSKEKAKFCGILNIGNSGFVNCILQVLFKIIPLKKIFKRLNILYESQGEQKSLKKQLIKHLSYTWESVRLNNHKIINVIEIFKILCKINKEFAGYSFKDCFVFNIKFYYKQEFFKFLLNFLHDEFKYINLNKFDEEYKFVNTEPIDDQWQMIENSSIYRDYSLIRTTFKGIIECQINCFQCRNFQQREEDFLGISLEIPLQKQKNKTFFGQMAQNLENIIKQTPSVGIDDCFTNFFEKNIPLLDNLYKCASCKVNSLYQRQYQFKLLPNIMVIQFERFQRDRGKSLKNHIIFPTQPYDFGQLLRLKDKLGNPVRKIFKLRAVIVHRSFEVGDHYETIHCSNNEYVSVQDEHVKLVDEKYVQDSIAYMLFYDQIPQNTNESLKKNLKANLNLIKEGAVKFTPENLCYLPSFWYQTFMHLARAPMIITSHLLCQHNQLKPDYYDCFDSKTEDINQSLVQDVNISFNQDNFDQSMMITQPSNSSLESLKLNSLVIPIPVCQFLIDQYGGGPVIPYTIQTCEICIEMAQLMRKRRRLERALISKYDTFQNSNYVISSNWINKWESFLYAIQIQLKNKFVMGLPPPMKINNSDLINNSQLIPNLQEVLLVIDYRLVTPNIWKILQQIYDGGPTIILKDNEEITEEDQSNLDEEDQAFIKEIKIINEHCRMKNKKQQTLTIPNKVQE